MNLGSVVFLCAAAAVAAGLAILAGSDLPIAVPLAAIAVAAAASLLVGAVERTRWPPVELRARPAAVSARVRTAFEEGEFGRVTLVRMLDALEPAGSPSPVRRLTSDELLALKTAPPEQFRRYLSERLDDLEART